MYIPAMYSLFGAFDIAIISLTDSYKLASRGFHPYNSKFKDEGNPQNFNYQIITGPIKKQGLEKKFDDIFLYDSEQADELKTKYDFIGICLLKVSNSLLVGVGGKLVDNILELIDTKAKEQSNQGDEVKYIVMHSFGWNEITLLLFSNNLIHIKDITLRLKSCAVKDLPNTKIQEYIQNESLAYKLSASNITTEKEKEEIKEKILHNHIFTNFASILGYNSDKAKEGNLNLKGVNLHTRWYLRVGHLNSFIKNRNEHFKKDIAVSSKSISRNIKKGDAITVGKGDIIFPYPSGGSEELKLVLAMQQSTEIKKSIRKKYTTVTFDHLKKEGEGSALNEHFPFADKCEKFLFSPSDIKKLNINLRSMFIPKTLCDRISKMYSIYNDGLNDFNLYAYFIDIHPFLKEMVKVIEYMATDNSQTSYDPVSVITERLQKYTYAFERAYNNRYFQSYVMEDLNDYNFDFNGGIQQLVTAYDWAYKQLSNLISGRNTYENFVHVSGFSGVQSSRYWCKINFLHIFQPGVFASIMVHEAANFFIDMREEKHTDNKLLMGFDFGQYLNGDCKERLNQEPFERTLQDIITFYIAYNANRELFFYWHWSSTMQMPNIYDIRGNIIEREFLRVLIRFLILDRLITKKDKNLWHNAYTPPCIQLTELWFKKFTTTLQYVDQLLEIQENQELMKNVKNIAVLLTVSEITNNIHRDFDEKTFGQFDSLKDIIQRKHKIKDIRIKAMDKLSELIMDKLEQGYVVTQKDFGTLRVKIDMGEIEIYPVDKYDEKKTGICYDGTAGEYNHAPHDAFYINVLYYSWLRLIYKNNNGFDKNSLLFRKANKNKTDKKRMGRESPVLFDPLGGAANTQPNMRRKLHKWRSAFMLSLWNIATKQKIKLFDIS